MGRRPEQSKIPLCGGQSSMALAVEEVQGIGCKAKGEDILHLVVFALYEKPWAILFGADQSWVFPQGRRLGQDSLLPQALL